MEMLDHIAGPTDRKSFNPLQNYKKKCRFAPCQGCDVRSLYETTEGVQSVHRQSVCEHRQNPNTRGLGLEALRKTGIITDETMKPHFGSVCGWRCQWRFHAGSYGHREAEVCINTILGKGQDALPRNPFRYLYKSGSGFCGRKPENPQRKRGWMLKS